MFKGIDCVAWDTQNMFAVQIWLLHHEGREHITRAGRFFFSLMELKFHRGYFISGPNPRPRILYIGEGVIHHYPRERLGQLVYLFLSPPSSYYNIIWNANVKRAWHLCILYLSDIRRQSLRGIERRGRGAGLDKRRNTPSIVSPGHQKARKATVWGIRSKLRALDWKHGFLWLRKVSRLQSGNAVFCLLNCVEKLELSKMHRALLHIDILFKWTESETIYNL